MAQIHNNRYVNMKSFLPLLLLLSFNTFSATFTVNSTSDTVDIAPGDGVCLDGIGDCSLRAAIMESNVFKGADTVYLQRSTTYELTLVAGATDASFGDLDILDSLTLSIINPGTVTQSADELPVIDANGIGRVIDVFNATSVTLFAVVITGGDTSNEVFNMGGGILVNTPITTNFNVLNSIVFGNFSEQGAGIQTYAAESLISFTDISFNGLLDGDSFTKGAGINNEGGDTTIQYSSIHNNAVNFNTPVCFGSVQNSSIDSDMFIFNSTIALNGTSPFNNCLTGVNGVQSSLFLVNATVTYNSGWGLSSSDSSGNKDLFIRNTIIATNSINDCRLKNHNGMINFGDANGGHNIASDVSCNMPAISGNMEITDPKLDEFKAVFPGFFPTFIYFEPLPDSPAIDNGSPLAVNVGDPNACQQFDQILRLRPIDGNGNGSAVCDIGAVENNYDLIFKSDFE